MARILGFRVTCGVEMMMSLHHGWGWQLTQTAPLIHIRHIQSVWAHWYAVHGHTIAALNSYIQPTLFRFLASGSGSHLESEWYHHFTVEADTDRHINLLPTHIRHIQSVQAHWYAVHRHTVAALNSYMLYPYTTWLRCWVFGSLVELEWCLYVVVEAGSKLKLLTASILDIYKVF